MDEGVREAAIELQNLATRLLRSARSASAKQGLGSAQYSALAVLYDKEALPLVALAQAERVSHPTMSRVVAGLARLGAVARTGDPADRRLRRVEITPEGRRIYEEVSSRRIAIAAAILAQLRPESVADLIGVVRQVAAAVDQRRA
jgi:DNA-binding MarR family transcriptional regulator